MVVGNKKVEGMEFYSLWRKIHLFIYAHTCVRSQQILMKRFELSSMFGECLVNIMSKRDSS